MTREYAALSVRYGVLSGRIDGFLGTLGFQHTGRSASWNLSVEALDQMKEQARQLGVPQEVLDKAEHDAAEIIADKELFERLRALQSEFDKKAGVQ